MVTSSIIGLDIGGTIFKSVKIQNRKSIVEHRAFPAGGSIGRGEYEVLLS